MFPKSKPIRSRAIRNSAQGEACTVNLPWCNYDSETTVAAHLQFEGGTMAGKPDDTAVCYACSTCHDIIDARRQERISAEEMDWYKIRALLRTQRRLFEKGLLAVKGAAA